MVSLTLTPTLHSFRGQSNWWPTLFASNIVQLQELRLEKWCIRAVSKISALESGREDSAIDNAEKGSKSSKQSSRRSRKKATAETPESSVTTVASEEKSNPRVTHAEDSQKVSRRGRKKATLPSSGGESTEKKVRRRTKKKVDNVVDQSISEELSNLEVPESPTHEGEEEELLFTEDEGEDISCTYDWPPLVCCFGAAQHAFIPSGRPANRLIDHEIHETQKDILWSPEKFVRAPGGSSSSVALALASIGGRVAFMGKVGDDEYGESILYHLNVSNVQTRSIKIDSSKPTAVSHMKLTRRGGLKMTCLRPCAEDSLLCSEVNIDVLKEAKMFYFNSSSLLDPNMRRTTLQALKASKKLGSAIFFDLNLPLLMWNSREETNAFIQQAWNYADIIEVTKQELEFLCGIEPVEKFDTKDNDKSKFIHHQPEVVKPLWHDCLQVLFVTNGTSKIHYYTAKDNGWVHGMEDPPISPFTSDMSVSGDAIVAALMRMLTVQPHLATDKSYLEHSIKYAIDCGVINQWLLTRNLGFPPKEGMDGAPVNPNGVRSMSEREYRTLEPVRAD